MPLVVLTKPGHRAPDDNQEVEMQYVMLIAGEESGRSNAETDPAVYAKIGEWFGEHGAAGRIVGGHELQPSATATTIRIKGGKSLVTDGPFVESKEVIGGYAILDVPDLDAAIKLASSWPGDAVLEVRPVVPGEQ